MFNLDPAALIIGIVLSGLVYSCVAGFYSQSPAHIRSMIYQEFPKAREYYNDCVKKHVKVSTCKGNVYLLWEKKLQEKHPDKMQWVTKP